MRYVIAIISLPVVYLLASTLNSNCGLVSSSCGEASQYIFAFFLALVFLPLFLVSLIIFIKDRGHPFVKFVYILILIIFGVLGYVSTTRGHEAGLRDQKRLADMTTIRQYAYETHKQSGEYPNTVSSLGLRDPKTGKEYEYQKIDKDNIQLCPRCESMGGRYRKSCYHFNFADDQRSTQDGKYFFLPAVF